MALLFEAEPVPLIADADGVARVAGTRVTLDTVVAAFHDGLTAEELVEQYPTLGLGSVYSVIGYYLRHEREVHAYLEARERQSDQARKENERRFSGVGVRSRLLARRDEQR